VEGKQLNYGGSLSILQPVYTGGRVLESIRMAQHQQSFAANQAKALNDAVCYQTDIQYWSAVARQEIVTVAEDFRNSIAALVKTIKERVEVGLVDPQDLLMAEVKLNEAEYQLLQAQSNFETGRMALNSMIGVRLEHPAMLIDQIQYHNKNGRGKYLPAAEYSFVTQAEGRGVYSFCMCPGGFIVPAASGPEQVVVNGMSPSNRGSRWSNSGRFN
jgi:hypothetical protein